MTAMLNELEKVNVDFWDFYNPSSHFKSQYLAILICEYTKKTWILYL